MRSIAIKETVSRPQIPPISLSFWLPFWLQLKALFRLYLMSPFWLLFNLNAGSRSVSILAQFQASQRRFFIGVVVGALLWFGFSTTTSLPAAFSVSAPQVAGPLPGLQISGRSRLRPLVWGGILPLFSQLACNLNTQNISCLTNRP